MNRRDDSSPLSPTFAAVVLDRLIRGYQRYLSPLSGSNCRFLPSCSEYAREAVARHGALRGSWLALCRILRCQPLCAGGHDPVPDRRNAARGHDARR